MIQINKFRLTYLLVFILFVAPSFTFADELKSANFTLTDTVINGAGVYGSSTSFQIRSNTDTILDRGSSASFDARYSFEYFPSASAPILSLTSSGTEALISWTNSQASNGAATSSYQLGYSTSSESGYIFVNVGTSTSYTLMGVDTSKTYYFIVRVLSPASTILSISSEISLVAAASTSTSASAPATSSGGGGGWYMPPQTVVPTESPSTTTPRDTPTPNQNPKPVYYDTNYESPYGENIVTLSGMSYPKAKVVILRDGKIFKKIDSDNKAEFKIDLKVSDYTGHAFSVYSELANGESSGAIDLPPASAVGDSVILSKIFISPTVKTNAIDIVRGSKILISGYTFPLSEVIIEVNSPNRYIEKTQSDKNGYYFIYFDSSLLEAGPHTTRAYTVSGDDSSQISSYYSFQVRDDVPDTDAVDDLGSDNVGERIEPSSMGVLVEYLFTSILIIVLVAAYYVYSRYRR